MQSVWDTSENETTKATGTADFNPYESKVAARKRSVLSHGGVFQTAEWLETNSRWLEALDPGSRLYFVDLQTQQTSWDPPEHFMCAAQRDSTRHVATCRSP